VAARRSDPKSVQHREPVTCYTSNSDKDKGEQQMSKFDQAKMLMKVKKMQKELQKQTITVSAGDDAVKVEITGEQKIKRIHIDPDRVDVDDIGQLEKWVEEAVKRAISESQKLAAEKMQPMMGMLGNLGL
jgi:DNA-binding YbaB/EbfC family protein